MIPSSPRAATSLSVSGTMTLRQAVEQALPGEGPEHLGWAIVRSGPGLDPERYVGAFRELPSPGAPGEWCELVVHDHWGEMRWTLLVVSLRAGRDAAAPLGSSPDLAGELPSRASGRPLASRLVNGGDGGTGVPHTGRPPRAEPPSPPGSPA